jgi:hypothetical protein
MGVSLLRPPTAQLLRNLNYGETAQNRVPQVTAEGDHDDYITRCIYPVHSNGREREYPVSIHMWFFLYGAQGSLTASMTKCLASAMKVKMQDGRCDASGSMNIAYR